MKNLSKYFVDARNIILTSGWHQGSYSGPAGQKCLLGALSDVTEKSDFIPIHHFKNNWDSIIDVFNILGLDAPSDWNDTPGRTEEEVLEMLDMATSLCLSND
jgi:hypothetical protein